MPFNKEKSTKKYVLNEQKQKINVPTFNNIL